MGFLTSTFWKRENSETSGRDSRDSFGTECMAFMAKGGCIEPFMGYVDCSMEAGKNNEDDFTKCKEVRERLHKCIGDHPDHYQQMVEIIEPVLETVLNKIEALYPPVDTISTESADRPEDGDVDPIDVFMNGGACMKPYEAWKGCMMEVMEDNEDISKCTKDVMMLIKCMDAHSGYYQPILDAVHAGKDVYRAGVISTLRGDSKKI